MSLETYWIVVGPLILLGLSSIGWIALWLTKDRSRQHAASSTAGAQGQRVVAAGGEGVNAAPKVHTVEVIESAVALDTVEVELRRRFQAEVDRLARLAAEAAQAARELREFSQREWRAVEEVLRESARSPRLGLLLLSAKIDRAAQELGDRFITEAAKPGARTPPEMVRQLVEIQLLPSEAAQALELFSTVRNQIVHGHYADEVEVARAIDSGTRLLRLLLLTRPEPETPSDQPSASP